VRRLGGVSASGNLQTYSDPVLAKVLVIVLVQGGTLAKRQILLDTEPIWFMFRLRMPGPTHLSGCQASPPRSRTQRPNKLYTRESARVLPLGKADSLRVLKSHIGGLPRPLSATMALPLGPKNGSGGGFLDRSRGRPKRRPALALYAFTSGCDLVVAPPDLACGQLRKDKKRCVS
jgi:hypothetical protein